MFATIASLTGSFLAGIRFNYTRWQAGKILGVSDTWETSQKVMGGMENGDVWQLHSGFGTAMLVLVAVAVLVLIWQFVLIIIKLGSEKNFGLQNILKIVVMNIVVFVVTVVGLSGLHTWIIERESPRNLAYERVMGETIRIVWESKTPVMSEVLWGYEADHLDNLNLGVAGEQVSTKHEVVLKVDPERQFYFKIVVHGVKYGDKGIAGYYSLPKNRQTETIYKLKLKE